MVGYDVRGNAREANQGHAQVWFKLLPSVSMVICGPAAGAMSYPAVRLHPLLETLRGIIASDEGRVALEKVCGDVNFPIGCVATYVFSDTGRGLVLQTKSHMQITYRGFGGSNDNIATSLPYQVAKLRRGLGLLITYGEKKRKKNAPSLRRERAV